MPRLLLFHQTTPKYKVSIVLFDTKATPIAIHDLMRNSFERVFNFEPTCPNSEAREEPIL